MAVISCLCKDPAGSHRAALSCELILLRSDSSHNTSCMYGQVLGLLAALTLRNPSGGEAAMEAGCIDAALEVNQLQVC